MARSYKSGRFKPRNPDKYRGDVSNIVFRSSWEYVALDRLDRDPSVLEYSSEETVIPYYNPLTGNTHRYFPDLKIKKKMPDGSIKTFLVEIKPEGQVSPPKGKKTKRFDEAMKTFIKNQAKWAAAKKYCEDRGFQFVIETEHTLGIARSKRGK